MKKLTYKEAYDKIIQAYFRDEINPYDNHFCFCGTLCDNSSEWHHSTSFRKHNDSRGYRGIDFVRMERALLDLITQYDDSHKYEEKLFNGMCAALDELKQIHREGGENVDELPMLEKRILVR